MNVLLVDDEKDCLDDILMALEPTGYKCSATTSPLEAIEIYKKEKQDVVISDVRMPEMNGIDLLKNIRIYDSNARVIIITAYGDLDTAKSAINNRAYAFFGKPINFSELILTLRNLEKELAIKNNLNSDYNNLQSEHEKLKVAYEELLNVITTIKK
ncbi:MAG TPA: response regulator [Spirochaetota bacterium]|nr:response regulator [Spirochaetota bacterium]